MVRLRNALVMAAMAVGGFGCSHFQGGHDYAHWSIFHCSECDDFPAPAYGPGGSMMPGSYSGTEPTSSASTRTATPTSSNLQPSNEEAISTPSEERPGNPTSETVNPPAGADAAAGTGAGAAAAGAAVGAGAAGAEVGAGAAPTPPSPPPANP